MPFLPSKFIELLNHLSYYLITMGDGTNIIDDLDEVFHALRNTSRRIFAHEILNRSLRANPEPFFIYIAKLLCDLESIPTWEVVRSTSIRGAESRPYADRVAFQWNFEGSRYRFYTKVGTGHTYDQPNMIWWFSKTMNRDQDPTYVSDSDTEDDTPPELRHPTDVPGAEAGEGEGGMGVTSNFLTALSTLHQRLLRLEHGRGNMFLL